jgi:hypothetical protein
VADPTIPPDVSPAAAFGIAVVPFIVLSLAHWHLGPLLVASDYAQYLLHARAIVEGRPYGDIGYLYSPLTPFVGPPLQPPGLPLTLVPLVWAFGMNDTVFRVAMVLSGVLFLVLATIALARTEGWLRAGCAAAIVGIAVERAFATNVPMSDLGFSALVWAVVVVADRPGRWSGWRGLAVSALVAGALAYRTAGAPLLPAIFAYGLFRRRTLGLTPLAVACVWGIVGIVVLLTTPIGAAAVRFAADARGISLLGVRFALETYSVAAFQPLLYPFSNGTANLVYHVITAPLALYGLWRWARAHHTTFLFAAAVAYAVFLLIAPAFQARYLWPLFPLIAAGFVRGLADVARMASKTTPTIGERRAVLAVGALAAAALVTAVRAPDPATVNDAPEVLDLYAWLTRANADSAARVAVVNPRVLTLRSGIPAMSVPNRGSEKDVYDEFVRHRITFVVEGDPGYANRERDLLRNTLRTFPQAFTPVYRNGGYTVYRFIPVTAGDATASGAGPADS